jgi:hypothetical protein
MTYVFLHPFISVKRKGVSLFRFIPVEMTCFGAGLDGAGAVIRT